MLALDQNEFSEGSFLVPVRPGEKEEEANKGDEEKKEGHIQSDIHLGTPAGACIWASVVGSFRVPKVILVTFTDPCGKHRV